MKTSNAYARHISPAVYERMPKTVLAALVVSFAHRCGGGDLDDFTRVEETILAEWDILHRNGIVPQPPRGMKRPR